MRILLLSCFIIFPSVFGANKRLQDRYMHPDVPPATRDRYNYEQDNASFWNNLAQNVLRDQIAKSKNENVAKNVILFIGDGMSIPTIAASRVYVGRGEETQLSFDKFPYVGLSKTYCVDRQVADSACSATAYLTGVKANYQTIGVTAAVALNDCDAMNNTAFHTHSIAAWSQAVGKATGLVTTTRVTHASPSGVYAHTANRNWETDTDIWEAGLDPSQCPDIAQQLIHGDTGSRLNVVLGGGRGEFYPSNATDEEGDEGFRTDQRNLVNEWLNDKRSQGGQYVWNKRDLLRHNGQSDYLLGLFDATHTPYNLDRDNTTDPSLEEMVEAAIKVLRRNNQGFFLFVEGGRIDTAHHEAKARKSFEEVSEFSKAIQKAVDMTDESDTLLVVTSDHAHSMTFSGYPNRGRDVLGLSGLTDDDNLPYFTINYANGPGFRNGTSGRRSDPSKEGYQNKEFEYPGIFPLDAETHGGDDVGIFARGPYSHLFTGVLEQHTIPHIMAYASCVGEGLTACGGQGNRGNQGGQGTQGNRGGSQGNRGGSQGNRGGSQGGGSFGWDNQGGSGGFGGQGGSSGFGGNRGGSSGFGGQGGRGGGFGNQGGRGGRRL